MLNTYCYMKTFVLVLAIVELFTIWRYFSLTITNWQLFSMRDINCTQRFRQKQKAGDAIVADTGWVSICGM